MNVKMKLFGPIKIIYKKGGFVVCQCSGTGNRMFIPLLGRIVFEVVVTISANK